MNKRETFGSRLGFLLVSAGCAIGIGNVWRFPYVVGQNGGGLFVLLYLFFLLVMGVPVLTMELAVGRAGRSSSLNAFHRLQPKGSFWHLHGIASLFGNLLLMMYYTTVSGWMLSYFFKYLTGAFAGVTEPAAVGAVFDTLTASPAQLIFWTFVTIIVGFVVVSFGLKNGVERSTKVMMSALLVLIIVLAAHSCTLPGADAGLKFYLVPSLQNAAAQGIHNVIVAAMNQAFFTLSLGIGSMEIFGSYMSADFSLAGEAVRISLLDTFVAICAGLIIFPACFAFGIQPDAGPSLIFKTLPNVFARLSAGRLWGSLFFMFMTFASFSTVIAVFENILSFFTDVLRWSRRRACIVLCLVLLAASLPCILSFNVLSQLTLIGGRGILDSEDFIVSNLLLPLGSLVYLLFCVTRWGWGFDHYLAEANAGSGIKLPTHPLFRLYLQFVLPLLIVFIFVSGLLPH